jgi:hypothetical protein
MCITVYKALAAAYGLYALADLKFEKNYGDNFPVLKKIITFAPFLTTGAKKYRKKQLKQ